MYNKKLYGNDKSGSIKIWAVTVTEEAGVGIITINHGKEGGKIQSKVEIVLEGKQGRSALEQAISIAEGKLKKNVDKGYRETKEELSDLPLLAMLAGDFHKIGHRIKFPCLGSDKYDGVRCMAKNTNGVITLESRTGQEYILPHITEELTGVLSNGEVLDGELYLHGYALQEITSAVKRTDPDKEVEKTYKAYNKNPSDETYAKHEEAVRIQELRPKLEFHIFDVPKAQGYFATRRQSLIELISRLGCWKTPHLFVVGYFQLENEEQMKIKHKDCVARGFEGIMLRNFDGVYESGKRSADLQKYKEFMDAEFEILDVVADKDGLGVFEVKNIYADNTFTVTLGSHVERAYQLAHKEEFIRKPLTVKFQSLYKGTLIPQFPTGVAVRDYE